MKRFSLIFSLAVLALSAVFPAISFAQTIARPPQFILLAYDGSYSLTAWEAIRGLAKKQQEEGKDTHFTFFASGVYFLQSSSKNLYHGPNHNPGRSDIGFGGSSTEIGSRIDEMNQAYSEGHEIGSHANGHFDGSKWSAADWTSEFDQFEKLIFDVFNINNINPARSVANGWLFKKSDIKGFRAPLLGTSPGMFQSLKDKDFSYDTSRVASTDYWPEKLATGLWNFPLASLKIAGTNKNTLSMDYNFYVAQSGAKADEANKVLYAQQMYDTYMTWFQKNYNGGRAPMNIGHHFSSWNGGAYFSAFSRFASKVCGLPEVRCVTYGEYIKWLDSQGPAKLASYKKGQFEKSNPVEIAAVAPAVVNTTVKVALKKDAQGHEIVVASAAGASANQGLTARLSVNGRVLNRSVVRVDEIKESLFDVSQTSVTAHLYDNKGLEISRATQTLSGLKSNITTVSAQTDESRAMLGDLPEAHSDEQTQPFVVPNF